MGGKRKRAWRVPLGRLWRTGGWVVAVGSSLWGAGHFAWEQYSRWGDETFAFRDSEKGLLWVVGGLLVALLSLGLAHWESCREETKLSNELEEAKENLSLARTSVTPDVAALQEEAANVLADLMDYADSFVERVPEGCGPDHPFVAEVKNALLHIDIQIEETIGYPYSVRAGDAVGVNMADDGSLAVRLRKQLRLRIQRMHEFLKERPVSILGRRRLQDRREFLTASLRTCDGLRSEVRNNAHTPGGLPVDLQLSIQKWFREIGDYVKANFPPDRHYQLTNADGIDARDLAANNGRPYDFELKMRRQRIQELLDKMPVS